MPHNINFREKKTKLKKEKKPEVPGEESAGVKGRVARFRYFKDISGYSGVSHAHFLFYTLITMSNSVTTQIYNE